TAPVPPVATASAAAGAERSGEHPGEHPDEHLAEHPGDTPASAPPPPSTTPPPPPPSMTAPPPRRPSSDASAPPRRPGEPTGPRPSGKSASDAPSQATLTALYHKEEYASVVRACSGTRVTSDIANVCVLAACFAGTVTKARAWLPAFTGPVKTIVARCKELTGVDITVPCSDCD